MTGILFPAGMGIIPLATTSRLALEPIQLPIQWLPEALFPEL